MGLELGGYLEHWALEPVLDYAQTLVQCHRAGCAVFSNTIIGKSCQQHVFSVYPLKMFEHLDKKWDEQARNLYGPGISVSVPPLLAIVLTRALGRNDLSDVIRDLREEYTSSRNALWNHLEEMWVASTFKHQAKLLGELEKASQSLFLAAFPERQNFIELAWSTTIKLADAQPLSALEGVGKNLLKLDEPTVVNAIGFTRKLSKDLRRVAGLTKLLPKILSQGERARFGLR